MMNIYFGYIHINYLFVFIYKYIYILLFIFISLYSKLLLNTEYKDLGFVEKKLIYLKNNFQLHPMLNESYQPFSLQNGISECYCRDNYALADRGCHNHMKLSYFIYNPQGVSEGDY